MLRPNKNDTTTAKALSMALNSGWGVRTIPHEIGPAEFAVWKNRRVGSMVVIGTAKDSFDELLENARRVVNG